VLHTFRAVDILIGQINCFGKTGLAEYNLIYLHEQIHSHVELVLPELIFFRLNKLLTF